MINDVRMTRRSALRLAGGGALAATALAVPAGARRAFAQDASTPGPVDGGVLAGLGLPELAITVTDTGYEGIPSELPAGLYHVTVSSTGNGPGFADFMQLPEGMTAADLMAMLGGGGGDQSATPVVDASATPVDGGGEQGGPPEWYYQVYMPGGAAALPGMTAHLVLDLRPGNYIVWAEDPSAPQRPAELTVTGDANATPSPSPAMLPQADVTINEVASDQGFAFQIDGSFTSGSQVVAIVNQSEQPHFVEIDLLPAGATKEDVDALFQSFMTGTPVEGGLTEQDVQPVYLAGTQSAGTTQWHELPVQAGTYLLACWVSDPTRGGIPHAMEGMYEVITVS